MPPVAVQGRSHPASISPCCIFLLQKDLRNQRLSQSATVRCRPADRFFLGLLVKTRWADFVRGARKSNFRPKEAGKAAHRSSARAEIEGAQRGRLLGSPTPPPKVAAAPFLMPWHQERTLNRAKSPVDPHEPSQRPHAAAGKKDAKTRVRARFFQRAERVERTRGRDP